MDVKEHYHNIKKETIQVYEQSLAEDLNIQLISKNHNLILELSVWCDILKDRSEYKIFETALKELQLSMATLNYGFYSKSFAGLRFFLERSLITIFFSAQEIELRLWEKGDRDTYWSEIMDESKGVFSKKFSDAFFPELNGEIKHFRNLTTKVYRECSEYVHGNNSIIESLPEKIEYNQDIFRKWHNKADTIGLIILFVLNLRYLKFLNMEDLKKLENVNLENFNNIKAIQELH